MIKYSHQVMSASSLRSVSTKIKTLAGLQLKYIFVKENIVFYILIQITKYSN